jgi:hypothetical protein
MCQGIFAWRTMLSCLQVQGRLPQLVAGTNLSARAILPPHGRGRHPKVRCSVRAATLLCHFVESGFAAA